MIATKLERIFKTSRNVHFSSQFNIEKSTFLKNVLLFICRDIVNSVQKIEEKKEEVPDDVIYTKLYCYIFLV